MDALKIDRMQHYIDPGADWQTRITDQMRFPTETLTFRTGQCTGFPVFAVDMYEAAGLKKNGQFIQKRHARRVRHSPGSPDDLETCHCAYYLLLMSRNLTGRKLILIELQPRSFSGNEQDINREKD